MSLLNFFYNICHWRQVAPIIENKMLTQQLSRNRSKGLDDPAAGALLLLQAWNLPQTNDTCARAEILSKNLGQRGMGVVALLMFSERIGVGKATKNAFIGDRFFNLHGCLYETAMPLKDFARKHMNRIWKKQRVDPADLSDSAFAAYYATLIAPFAVDAWIMLTDLKQLGFCPNIDNRDHVEEGIKGARRFLETAESVDPEFCALLNKGIELLSKMKR